MFEQGESSQAIEETPCRDVQVVSVQPYGTGRRPVKEPRFPDDPYQSEGEQLYVRRVTTRRDVLDVLTGSLDPVPGYTVPPILRDYTLEDQGEDFLDVHLDAIQLMATGPRVTRGSREEYDDENFEEVVPETDPEEDLGKDPSGYLGNMSLTSDDTVESHVAHREHEERSEPFSVSEGTERQLEDQMVDTDQIVIEGDAARAEIRRISMELRTQTTMREFVQGAWVRSADRVTQLEEQVRDGRARIHRAISALNTAMTRLRRRVRRSPQGEGMSRDVINRQMVDRMIFQEHREAIRRMDRDEEDEED